MAVARLYYTDAARFGRSCLDCRRWLHEADGSRREDRTKTTPGNPVWLPLPRGTDPPCHTCGKTVGLKVRHWRFAPDPPEWCYRAFYHYRQCRAVGWSTPDARDPIVRRNAVAFDAVRESAEEAGDRAVLISLGLLKRR